MPLIGLASSPPAGLKYAQLRTETCPQIGLKAAQLFGVLVFLASIAVHALVVYSYQDTEKQIATASGKLSIDDMLSMIHTTGSGPPGPPPNNSTDAKEDGDDPEDASEAESSSDPEPGGFNLASRLAAMRKKAAAPPKVAKSNAAASSVGLSGAKLSSGKPGIDIDSRCSVVIDDGRTKRLRDGLEQELNGLVDKAKQVCDLRDLVDNEHIFGKSKAFHTSKLNPLAKNINSILGDVKKATSRIANSRNREVFADIEEKIEKDVCEPIQAVKETVTALFQDSRATATEMVEKFSKCCQMEFLKPSLTMLSVAVWSYFEDEVRLCNYHMACNALCVNGHTAYDFCDRLVALQDNKDASKSIANNIVESYVIRICGKLTQNEFATNDMGKAANRNSLCKFARSFAFACCSFGEGFLPIELKIDIATLAAFLQPEQEEPAKLDDCIARRARWAESTDKLSPIAQFLTSTGCGDIIWQHVTKHHKDHAGRREADEAKRGIRTHVLAVIELALNEQTSTGALSEEHKKAIELISKQPEKQCKQDNGETLTKAAALKLYADGVLEAGTHLLSERMRLTWSDAVAWCTQQSPSAEAADYQAKGDLWQEELTGKLAVFWDENTKVSFKRDEEACKHTCHLVEHFAVAVRKSADDPAVDAEVFSSSSGLAGLCKERAPFLENYGDSCLVFAEELSAVIDECKSKQGPAGGKYQIWYNALPPACFHLYHILKTAFSTRSEGKERSAVEFYSSLHLDAAAPELGAKLREALAMTAELPSSSRHSFALVHDYLVAVVEAKKLLDQFSGASGSGTPGATPFSQSGLMKKNLSVAIATLQTRVKVLKSEVAAWVEGSGGSNSAHPTLQKMHFQQDYVLKLVGMADGITSAVSNTTINSDLLVAKGLAAALQVIFEKAPDPVDGSEKKFLSYMAKNGTAMNNKCKELEKAFERAKASAVACNVELQTVDTEDVAASVEDLKVGVLNLITLNTLIVLLRAPKVRTDQQMRTMAANVFKQFQDNQQLVLMTKYKQEAEELLGIASASGVAVPGEDGRPEGGEEGGALPAPPAKAAAPVSKRGRSLRASGARLADDPQPLQKKGKTG